MDANDRRRELTNRCLVTLDGLDLGGEVRFRREDNVESHDLLDALESLSRFARLAKLFEKMFADELEILAVGTQVPLRRETDSFVRNADAQAVLDVREVALASEEAQEILALGSLDAAHRRLVGKELFRVGVREKQSIEVFDNRVRVFLRERSKPRKALQVLLGQLEKGSARLQLGFVEHQHLHVPAV